MPGAAWVLLLQGVLVGAGRMPELMTVKLGRPSPVDLHCSPDATGPMRWVWEPKFTRCAGLSRENLLIDAGGSPKQELPPRFQGRLSLRNMSLELRDPVMSDSGVFTCSGVAGPDLSTDLRIEGGCYNNLSITFTEHKGLVCKVCRPISELLNVAMTFSWTVNGRAPWQETVELRGKQGVRVVPDLSSEGDWGMWRCTSMEIPAWHADYCFEPADIDYTPPGEDDANPETLWKPLFQIFVAAGAVLALILAAILLACHCRSKSKHRKKEKALEEELENMEDSPPSQDTLPFSERRHAGTRSCLPRTGDMSKTPSDDLLYVQLDHFPVKQDAKRPPPSERTTIYATIV